MEWLMLLGVFVFFLLMFLVAPFTVELFICKKGEEDHLSVKLGIGTCQLELIKIPSLLKHWTKLLNYYFQTADDAGFTLERELSVRFPSLITKFLSGSSIINKANCKHLEWSTQIGIANPALTGITAGFLWNLKHRFYRYLVESTAGVSAVPSFSVVPSFSETKLELEFRCIFAFRGGHIITATCQILWTTLCSFMRGDKLEQPSH